VISWKFSSNDLLKVMSAYRVARKLEKLNDERGGGSFEEDDDSWCLL